MKKNKSVIVIGWNACSQHLVNQLLEVGGYNITLIEKTLADCPKEGINFIKMDFDYQFNIDQIISANFIVITADQTLTEEEADRQSIITLLTIKRLNESAHCLVQILTEKQMNNAKRAGADEIICTSKISSSMILDHFKYGRNSPPVYKLLAESNNTIGYISIPKDCLSKSFEDCVNFYSGKSIIPIGVKRKEEIRIYPNKFQSLLEEDLLIALCRIES